MRTWLKFSGHRAHYKTAATAFHIHGSLPPGSGFRKESLKMTPGDGKDMMENPKKYYTEEARKFTRHKVGKISSQYRKEGRTRCSNLSTAARSF